MSVHVDPEQNYECSWRQIWRDVSASSTQDTVDRIQDDGANGYDTSMYDAGDDQCDISNLRLGSCNRPNPPP